MSAKRIPQFTSLDAYLGLTPKHLQHAQAVVYDTIARLGEATDKEIADALGWTINRVTPRRGELQAMYRVRCVGERLDQKANRRSMIWAVNQ